MNTMRKLLLALLATATLPAAATTLFDNATIHTLDPVAPLARALLVDDRGRIVALDPDTERRAEAGTIVDLQGATMLPGLIDAHGHLLGLGLALLSADLTGADSKEAIVERLRQFESRLPDGAWLTGRGWDQNRWPGAEFPTAADLDGAFPERPVWLARVDGHAGWANTAALRRVERDLSGDWQPEGGRILRDDEGNVTGVFIGNARDLVTQAQPPLDQAIRLRALELALAEATRFGLTGVHDAGVDLDTLALMRRLADEERLPIRVYAMADGDGDTLDWLCRNGAYVHTGGRLQMRAVKLYMDGALGSRGAALLAGYRDDPGNRGLLETPVEAMESAIAKAVECGMQANIHAIGDRGNRIVLDALEKRVPADQREARRARIEHAQIVADEDIPRFARLHVIASMQPIHATSDMPWAQARLGTARLRGAYAWQRLLDSGARLAFGSDFPVEPVNPFLGLYAAITRQDEAGEPEGGWLPDQRVDLATALEGFTIDAAYAGFAENELGSLTVGKRADFIVLDHDPLELAPAQLRALQVRATYLDGRQVHPAPTSRSP